MNIKWNTIAILVNTLKNLEKTLWDIKSCPKIRFYFCFSYIFVSLFCPLHFVCACMCTCVYFVFEKIETEKWKPDSQLGTWIVYG